MLGYGCGTHITYTQRGEQQLKVFCHHSISIHFKVCHLSK